MRVIIIINYIWVKKYYTNQMVKLNPPRIGLFFAKDILWLSDAWSLSR